MLNSGINELVIGIDVGVTGAIAVLEGRSLNVIDCLNMPTEIMRTKKRRVDAVVLNDWINTVIESFTPCKVLMVIEHVHSRPNDGHQAAFAFGDSFGSVRGVLASKPVSIEYVSPLKWKNYFRMKGMDKDYSRTVAKEKLPNLGGEVLKFKKDHNKADALLIALYGAENLLK